MSVIEETAWVWRRPTVTGEVATIKVIEATRRIIAAIYLVVPGKSPKAPPLEPLLIVQQWLAMGEGQSLLTSLLGWPNQRGKPYRVSLVL
jgi:hypothetical protein